MNKLHSLILAITLLVGSVSVATAQDFNKGLEAAQSGDYQTALREWRPLAEQGVAIAQFNLGVMYQFGDGVLQSNVMAHMWYNIASANGHPKLGERRDGIAGQMTSAEISKAQEMARECMASDYQNCGE